MKVLLVDDNPDIVESTAVALQMMGVEVASCTRADQILGAMRSERPDVVLQDAFMPSLDVAAHLRALRGDPDIGATPVLLFTANKMKLQDFDPDLVQGVVEKPFDLDALLDALEKAAAQTV